MPKLSFFKIAFLFSGVSLIAFITPSVFAININTSPKSNASESTRNVEVKEQNIAKKVNAQTTLQSSKAALLKTKLDAFKNQEKATIAGRVSVNLNRINQKESERMQKHLLTAVTILNKLELRVSKATNDIKNPAQAETAIATARQAIATASSAVTVQAEKDYTIQVSRESMVKIEAKAQRDLLQSDLLATRGIVINAKQSVADAISITKSGKITTTQKEGTASGQQ